MRARQTSNLLMNMIVGSPGHYAGVIISLQLACYLGMQALHRAPMKLNPQIQINQNKKLK